MWEEIDTEIIDMMMAYGPDGHIDGHELLTDMVVRRVMAERTRCIEIVRNCSHTCLATPTNPSY